MKRIVCMGLLLTQALIASPSTESFEPVSTLDSGPVSPLYLEEQLEEERVISHENHIKSANERASENKKVETLKKTRQFANNYGYSYYGQTIQLFPQSDHYLFDLTGSFDKLMFEDGSVWAIDSGDQYKMKTWRKNDPLTLTRNHDWFGQCYFRVNNLTSLESVRVNLYRYPTEGGALTLKVTNIDYNNKRLMLSNGAIFKVFGSSWDLMNHWRIYDTVIIGRNDCASNYYRPNILINCNSKASFDACWEY